MFYRPFNRPAFSRLVALTGCVLSAALAASACTSDDSATNGSGAIPPPGPTGGDGGKLGASDGSVPPGPSTTFRVAHLSPDLPPIDFCYRNTTSDTWVGPVLNGGGAPGAPSGDAAAGNDAAPPSADAASADARSADASDASPDDAASAPDASLGADAGAIDDASVGDAAWLDAASASDAGAYDADADTHEGATADAGATDGSTPSAIAFLSVTDYVSVAGSGTFDIELVAAGSTGCGEPRAGGQVTLGAGKRATIAIVGRASADSTSTPFSLAIVAFIDDPSVAEKAARVRFVNAALGNASRPAAGALVASLRTNGESTPLAADIEPSHAATPTGIPPVIDALGYDDTAPVLDPARIMLDRVDGTWPSPWAGPMVDLALRAGSIHTGFIVNGNSSILRVVWCNDTDEAAPVARCTVLDPSP